MGKSAFKICQNKGDDQLWISCKAPYERKMSKYLFLFDYFYANVHALSNLFHSIKSSFNQASNHVLVLTVCIKLDTNSNFYR